MTRTTHGSNRRTLATCALLALLGLVTLITGCNTIEGVGRDVSAAGQTVADWASDDSAPGN